MPEGDSVWRAAHQLHQALAGQQLTASDFRVPRFATLNLAGWTVNDKITVFVDARNLADKAYVSNVQPAIAASRGCTRSACHRRSR